MLNIPPWEIQTAYIFCIHGWNKLIYYFQAVCFLSRTFCFAQLINQYWDPFVNSHSRNIDLIFNCVKYNFISLHKTELCLLFNEIESILFNKNKNCVFCLWWKFQFCIQMSKNKGNLFRFVYKARLLWFFSFRIGHENLRKFGVPNYMGRDKIRLFKIFK